MTGLAQDASRKLFHTYQTFIRELLSRLHSITRASLTLKFILFSLLNCLVYRMVSSGTETQILAK